MPNSLKDRILAACKAENVEVIGELTNDPDTDGSFIAFIELRRDKRGYQRPSKLTLSKLSNTISDLNARIDFVLIQNKRIDMTSSVKTALEQRLPRLVNNVFINEKKSVFEVWIEPRQRLSEDEMRDVQSVVSELFSVLRVKNHRIIYTTSAKLPTPTSVLSAIRTLAPASPTQIEDFLKIKGFEIPNRIWTERMLDRLRRSERLLRLAQTQKYVLTLNTLKLLGSRKDRMSPDVVRALDLARRRE
jgi:hypothetical protein